MSGNILKDRDDDETLLRILDMRQRYGGAATARWIGMRPEKVRTLCNRVLEADLATSVKDGIETREHVLDGYWRV